jgi:chromosome segregation ATPase
LLKGFNKLEKQTSEMSQTILEQQQTIKELRSELTRVASALPKITDFEERLKEQKGEIKLGFKDHGKQTRDLYKELEGKFQSVQKGVEKTLGTYAGSFDEEQPLRKSLKALEQEDKRLADQITSITKAVQDVTEGEARREQLAVNLKEDAARDAKRAATMQGEVAAVLQRMDQAAAKVELVLDAQKRVDQKLETLTEQEEIRREQQKEFLERVNGLQQDHEHTWKDWAKRFDIVERQSEEIGVRLKDVETTDLAVRRAQRAFDELVEKITRRVNELNEVQRLGEQRLRQEWSTHQADSQKRWSNFVLSQEEQQRELERQRERMAGRVTEVEDRLQDVQDTAQHLMEQIERYLQSVLEATRDSLNEGERFYKNPG